MAETPNACTPSTFKKGIEKVQMSTWGNIFSSSTWLSILTLLISTHSLVSSHWKLQFSLGLNMLITPSHKLRKI